MGTVQVGVAKLGAGPHPDLSLAMLGDAEGLDPLGTLCDGAGKLERNAEGAPPPSTDLYREVSEDSARGVRA